MQGVVILFIALIAWGSSLSWGACVQISGWGSGQYVGNCGGYIRGTCDDFTCSGWNTAPSSCAPSVRGQQGGGWYIFTSPERCPSGFNLVCHYTLRCDDDGVSADSANCVNEGNVWQNGQCQGPIDSSACDGLRAQCNQIPGAVFNGSVDPVLGCCVATCDYCKAGMLALKIKQQECCNQNLAPPDGVRRCQTLSRATCGMNGSEFLSNSDPEFACQDPSLDSTTMQRYIDQCFEPSSSDSQPGSSGSGSSSSGEGGESSSGESPYPEGCDECPWLDSILDTLTLNKWNTDDIVACLTTPGLCAGLVQEPDTFPVFAFDTAFNNYLKPLMDSALKVDSLQLKALLKLDTSILKQLKNDTLSLKNDTTTWHRIDALGNVIDGSISTANDTTRKWFRRIADSIGVSTDSLAAHLDSILEHIPDSILDSIVKYQRYATDNFDSVLFGHGKGFSLVDSLIDSSVKYFKESNQKWNEYISMYGDSTQKIHEELIDLPGRNASAIGSALGYGDTATSTLRGDLNGIREAIEGVGNGLGGKIADGIDSAWGDGKAPSDTVGDGPFGGYDSESDSIGNAYLRSVGGLLDSAINDTAFDRIFALGGDTVDWNAAARVPSVDSLKARMDSSIVAQRTEIEDSLQAAFDTLKDEFMLLDYDSLILAPLGMRVPNSNTCPDHCFTYTINGSGANAFMAWLGNVHELKFPFCDNLPGFSFNVLQLIRVIGRLFTAMFCIYIGLWFIAGKK